MGQESLPGIIMANLFFPYGWHGKIQCMLFILSCFTFGLCPWEKQVSHANKKCLPDRGYRKIIDTFYSTYYEPKIYLKHKVC